MVAILDAILNISISPMMPRWHHSVSMYGHIGEHIYAKTFCADIFFGGGGAGLQQKSSFGNLTISKEIGNDKELIQSNSTSYPQTQKGEKNTNKN